MAIRRPLRAIFEPIGVFNANASIAIAIVKGEIVANNRRIFLQGVAALALLLPRTADAAFAIFQTSNNNAPQWKTLLVGGGGFITGIDITSDGTKLARSDTPPSLFLWSDIKNKWLGLNLSTSMPTSFVSPRSDKCVGCWAARIAPSLTSTIYQVYAGSVFKSINSGATWTQLTGFTANIGNIDGNDNYRNFNHRMIVDPINPLICFIGTGGANGLQFTTDGGTTWNGVSLASVPASTTAAGILLVYNPSNTSGGITQEIFALSYGNGVYRSTNAGSSWTKLNTANMPSYAANMVWDTANNKLWVCSQTSVLGTMNGLYTWTSGSGWVHVGDSISDAQSQTMAIDPSNSNHLVLAGPFGRLCHSSNGGTNWSTAASDNTTVTGIGDATWMACNLPPVGGWGISPGSLAFDPTQSNICYQGMGFGVWKFNIFASGSSLTITTQSRGIESLDANCIINPSSGNIIGAAWDLPIWAGINTNTYATAYGPQGDYNGVSPNYGVANVRCWSLDYVRSSPSTIVAVNIGGHACKSIDSGATWTDFTDQTPFTGVGAQIAASTTSHYVGWSNGGSLKYTLNSGGSWGTSAFSGGTPGITGFGQSKPLCADSITADTYYFYDMANATGVYKSTDGGQNFTKVSSYTVPNIGPTLAIKSVPGNAGHLFITGGFLDTGTPPISNDPPSISTDGGITWTAINKLTEVTGFGFGTIVAGQSYPTIYVACWLVSTGKYGVYKCINFNPASIGSETWTLLQDQGVSDTYPLGFFSCIQDIAGDPSIDGACSIAFQNGGFARFA